MRIRQIPSPHSRSVQAFAALAVLAAAALIPGEPTSAQPVATADVAVTAAPGNGDAVLHLAPPLICGRTELDEMVEKTRTVLADASERFFA